MSHQDKSASWAEYLRSIGELENVATKLASAQKQASEQYEVARRTAEGNLDKENARADEVSASLERSLKQARGFLARVQYESLLPAQIPSGGKSQPGASPSDIPPLEREINGLITQMVAVREDEHRRRFEAEEAERQRLAELERTRLAAKAMRARLLKVGGAIGAIFVIYGLVTGLF
jgi:hypothetical protein